MDYWAATMQDDAYLIAAEGWRAVPYRVIETKKGKDGKPGRQVDKGWACDLVPKGVLVARCCAAEQAAIDRVAAELEAVGAKLAELEEEHGGDDAAFAGFDKVNVAGVRERLREIESDDAASGAADAAEEAGVLNRWLGLSAERGALKRKLEDAEATLDAVAHARYASLTEAEVKALVVDDKWLAALDAAVHGEMDRVSQALTQRVKELAERYGTPLPRLAERVDEMQGKVERHLAVMGFAWK